MPKYSIDYHKRVIKFLSKQDMGFRKKILNIFEDIALNPFENSYDIKPFKSNTANQYRLRVGKYRFIYEIKNNILCIYVSDAGSRGGIYK